MKFLQPNPQWGRKLAGCVMLVLLQTVYSISAVGSPTTGDDKDPGDKKEAAQDSLAVQIDDKPNFRKVTSDQIKDIPAADLENLLQGRLSGFFVQNWTGAPGIQSVMSVNTVNTGVVDIENRPLILVNEVPIFVDASPGSQINPLSQISPEYIESIEVLNSATSLARYGARGANGVIRITTKNAQEYGTTRISFNLAGGVNFAPQLRQTISGNAERRRLRALYDKAIVLPENINGISMPLALTDSLNSFYGYSTDRQKDDYDIRAVQNYNMNIGNSGVYGHYLLHMGYYNEESPKVGAGLKRLNLNLNTGYNVTKKLKLDVLLHAARIDRGNNTSNLFAPSYYPANDNPDLFLPTTFEDDAELRDYNSNNHLLSVINVDYKVNDHISLNSRVGVDYETGRRDYFVPSTINNGRIFISAFTTRRQQLINENTLNYNREINGRLFKMTLGQSIITNDAQYTQVSADRDAEGTSNFVKTIGNISLADVDGSSFLSKNALLSFFADAEYAVTDDLQLRGVVRFDGSSKMPKNNRWGVYPALGATWDVSSLLEDASWLSGASLRADVGRSGILPTEDHLWKSDIRTIGDYYQLTSVTRYARTNDDFTNATSTNATLGVDLSFLDNAIYASGEFFTNSIQDFHYEVMLPNTVGFSPEVKNGIDMKNTGVNLVLGANTTLGQVTWNSRLLASMVANELTNKPADANNNLFGSMSVGYPINGYYVHASDGVYATDEEVPVNPQSGNKLSYGGVALKAGMPKLLDRNGDYVIDQNDRYYVGSQQPRVYGGFGNTLSLGGFYLDALFTYSLGGKILTESVTNRYTSDTQELNRGMFKGVDEETNYYILQSDEGYVSMQGVAAIEESTYVRLNNLTIGYNFGETFLSKIGFGTGRVYLTGQNLFVTGGSYSGLDPEENRNGINNFNLSTTGIPRYKSVAIGLSLGL